MRYVPFRFNRVADFAMVSYHLSLCSVFFRADGEFLVIDIRDEEVVPLYVLQLCEQVCLF